MIRCVVNLIFLASLSVIICRHAAASTETVDLIDPQDPLAGWTFGNGPEFPGATGELLTAVSDDGAAAPALELRGDFSQGGLYVQASRKLDDLHLDTLSMQVRSPNDDVLTMRLIDATGQCHQIKLRVRESDRWQTVELPVRRFFDRMGKPGALDGVVRYQFWGGAKDGKWRGPAKSIHFLTRKRGERTGSTLMLRGLAAKTSPPPAAAAEEDAATYKWVPLLELVEGQTEWNFFKGREFEGSDGSFEVVETEDEALPHGHLMRLSGDFTGVGYVGVARSLGWMQVRSLKGIRFKLRTDTATSFNLRVADATGQTFQRKRIKLNNDGQWHEYMLDIDRITSSEAWGGAKDRKWHGSPRSVVLMLSHQSGADGKPVLEIADVALRVAVGSRVEAPSFEHGFEGEGGAATEGWSLEGDVAATDEDAAAGRRALRLSRKIEQVEQATAATGPAFSARPGPWDVRAAMRPRLVSPDNSFRGVVRVQWLDGAGKVIESAMVADRFGEGDWASAARRVTAPPQTVAGRFRAEMLKAHGTVDVDNLAAAFVAAGSHEGRRINRALIRHERLGNLLMPGDEPLLALTVEAVRPLPAEQREVSYTLHDYWGNEQGPARTTTLEADGRNKAKRFVYRGELDLSGMPLEPGRYYETHIRIAQDGGEPFEDFRSLAVLPEAPSKQYHWKQIPFTSRNWDNRIKDYILLSDRLGLRTVGLRADWSPKPPYKAGASLYKTARELDMGVVLNTVIWKLEHHRDNYKEYDPTALREGARNLTERYAMDGHAVLTLGNEPRLTEERVLEVKDAYRIVYEAIKQTNPDVTVVGTAVGPSELYLSHGIGAHKDAYDLHTYEDPSNIRKAMARYRRLFEKYGHPAPIWATELGLNSQGLTRRAVANSLIRKFSIFFAEGGANVSWFTIYYPDRNAKLHGGSEDSHNTFDGRYAIASPRLDAIAYYNMINGILIKDFVEEKQYRDGIEAFLFRDDEGRCLQVLWSDSGESDVMVPLDGVDAVTLTTIDGTVSRLDAAGRGVTVRVGPDALLLQYDGPATLPDRLGDPEIVLVDTPALVTTGGAIEIGVEAPGDAAVSAPPMWRVEPLPRKGQVQRFALTAPPQTTARLTPLAVSFKDDQGRTRGRIDPLVPVTGQLTASLAPLPAPSGQDPGVRLVIRNHADTPTPVRWSVDLEGQVVMRDGQLKLTAIEPASAKVRAVGDAEPTVTVPARGQTVIDLALSESDPIAIYRLRGVVEDEQGNAITRRRWVGGFAPVVRSAGDVTIDGKLDEPGWSAAAPVIADQPSQFRLLKKVDGVSWDNAEDLAGEMRFLWDDRCLYLGIEVTDDRHVSAEPGMPVWRQDGVQLLFAPGRGDPTVSGKADFGIGLTDAGPRAHCYLTADPSLDTGPAPDVHVAIVPNGRGSGGRTYEIAIPWSRLSPFEPTTGANLGLTVALNEDDGHGRYSYLSWFGDVQTKQIDAAGDLILTDEQGQTPVSE